jgi:dihydrofolate reductase
MSAAISMIAALDESRGIGKRNALLWHIPEDMKRFRDITKNHPIIMGRNTYESIGKPLPHRTNIVITRDPNKRIPGCIVCTSLESAIEKALQIDRNEIFLIGGGNLYKQGIDLSAKLYLTIVKGIYEADTFFPRYDKFTKIIRKEEKSDKNYHYTFLELEK